MGNSMLKNAWILTKTGLFNAYGLNKLKHGANRGRAVGMLMLIGIAVASMLFYLFTYFYLIAVSLNSIGQLPVLLSLSVTMGLLACFLMTVIRGSGFLFNFKDFDLLASMPVQRQALLLSKIAQLYVSLLAFTLLLMVPTTIVYGYVAQMPFYYYILAVLLIFFVPAVPIALGCIIALPVGILSSRWKYSNLISIVITFGIIIIYLGFNFSMSANMYGEGIGKPIADFFGSISIPLITLFSGGLADLNIVNIVGFAVINGAVLYLFSNVFGRAFQSVNAVLTEKASSAAYKMTSLDVSSVSKTLYTRELKSYFSCNVYVINTGTGMVMLLAYAVLTIVIGPQKVAQMIGIPLEGNLLIQLSAAVALFCTAMTCTTASSISMEGNRLWITKSLPISTQKLFLSKILVNMTITLPVCAVVAVFLGFGLNLGILSSIGFFVMSAAFSLLVAHVGLIANLLYPKLDWKAPVQAIKQSMSVMAAMLVNFVFAGLSIAAYFIFSGGFVGVSAIIAAVSFFLSYALWLWIKGAGVKLYGKFE